MSDFLLTSANANIVSVTFSGFGRERKDCVMDKPCRCGVVHERPEDYNHHNCLHDDDLISLGNVSKTELQGNRERRTGR